MKLKPPIPIASQNWSYEPLPLDDRPVRFDRLLVRAQVMKRVLNRLLAAARSDVPVLILGETGTGKDLAAESIHLRSRRKDRPFVVLNAGAIPRDLVASELFGHEAGAFTGSQGRRRGKLAQADGGTLFLDEINSLDLQAQAALLRVVEDGVYSPVGGDQARRCDVRVIAACNVDLQGWAQEGRFRADLFWRLEAFTLRLPALRERPGAVAMLATQFMKDFNASQGLMVRGFEREAVKLLEAYAWPGNVRELKNVVQSAVLLARSRLISAEHLPERVSAAPTEAPDFRFPLGQPLKALEAAYLARSLADCGGNKLKAAQSLGISRKALYAKLERQARR